MTLPVGWSWTSLEDLIGEAAPIVYGIIQAGPEVPNGIPYIRPTELVDGRIDIPSLKRTSPLIASRYTRSVLRAGDVVLAIVGTIGKLAIVPPELEGANITQSSARLRPPGLMPPAYLAAALQSPQLRAQFDNMEFGVAVRRLNIAHVRALQIPVAPANEQARIVEKLDAIFEQTRTARARLERLPALLEKLKRSILASAFRGDLTADWRAVHPDVEPASVLLDRIRTERRRRWEADLRAKGKDPAGATYKEPAQVDAAALADLPLGWAWASVDDVSELQLGQQRAPIHAAAEETYPYIRAANIKWSGLELSDVKRMGFPDPQRYLLRAGDVLLSEASGSPTEVGKSAIWRDEIPGCCYQKTLLRARPRSPEVSSEWLHASFLADALLGRFARMAPGVGILHLTADRMLPWPIPMAPAVEQSVIIRRLQLALGTIARLERVLTESLRSVEGCERAALARAFRGDLVPQDPSDEPAAVLLDRIRAARADAPQSPRRGRDQRAADAPSSSRKSNGNRTTASRDDSLDLVVAALQQGEPRLTAADIADATNLDAPAVTQVLKALVVAGQVRVHGNARGTSYEWIA
jgi:type I restriction enzyme S subunit